MRVTSVIPMISSNFDLVVVTPIYEDVEASGHLFKELHTLFGNKVFVVAVDDGSVNNPLQEKHLEVSKIHGCVLKLRRNVGHQQAISIGLSYVSEFISTNQRVVIMDCDGEDVPSTIASLLRQLESENLDVVVAQRKNRVETNRFKIFYAIYKRFFKLMTGRAISFGNFMALKPNAVNRLVTMPETSIHVASGVLASKLRAGICPLDRGARYAGKSKMNFVGLALHGFKGFMVFAEDVLVRVWIACAGVAVFALIGATTAVILKLLGFATPGWFSIALGVLILIFLQTGALALMTLMLTGVVRGRKIVTPGSHQEFIAEVLKTA